MVGQVTRDGCYSLSKSGDVAILRQLCWLFQNSGPWFYYRQASDIIWARVDEPDGKASDPGAIYMWMRLEGGNEKKWWFANPSAGTLPQVFKFSYSREFHKAIVSALGKILEDNGNPIEIAFNETDDQRRKTGRMGATHGQGGDGSQVPADETGSMSLGAGVFYVLPPAKLPPKLSIQ